LLGRGELLLVRVGVGGRGAVARLRGAPGEDEDENQDEVRLTAHSVSFAETYFALPVPTSAQPNRSMIIKRLPSGRATPSVAGVMATIGMPSRCASSLSLEEGYGSRRGWVCTMAITPA